MCLREVLAPCSFFFPDKCRGIDAKNINAKICIKENSIDHFNKDLRVGIIEIPLVIMKYGHHPFVAFFDIRKISRGCFWKNIRHRSVIFISLCSVIKKIKIILVLFVTFFCFHCPFMLVRSMIEHNIKHKIHILLAHFVFKVFQIIKCSKSFIYFFKIRNRIATIACFFRTFK